MRNPALVHVPGPLAPFAEGFRDRLELSGYAPESRVVHLRLMTDLSGWLGERGLDGSALSASVADGFVRDCRASGRRDARSVRSPRPVRERPAGPVEAVLADYAVYLTHERGLAAATIERNTDLVRPFLSDRVAGGLPGLEALTSADVIAFMLACSESASPATVPRTGTALRSLLRFLHLHGVTSSPLGGAVPTAANWKLAGLPKYLTGDQVAALLASCDPGTAVGRRDAAIS